MHSGDLEDGRVFTANKKSNSIGIILSQNRESSNEVDFRFDSLFSDYYEKEFGRPMWVLNLYCIPSEDNLLILKKILHYWINIDDSQLTKSDILNYRHDLEKILEDNLQPPNPSSHKQE